LADLLALMFGQVLERVAFFVEAAALHEDVAEDPG
jgi:hypothetical protein